MSLTSEKSPVDGSQCRFLCANYLDRIVDAALASAMPLVPRSQGIRIDPRFVSWNRNNNVTILWFVHGRFLSPFWGTFHEKINFRRFPINLL